MTDMEDALKHAGYAVVRPATRLANTISSLTYVLIFLVAISTIGIAVAAQGEFAFVVVVYGAMLAISLYVTFGWLEQTLRLLIGIAYNTAEGADLMPTTEDDGSTD